MANEVVPYYVPGGTLTCRTTTAITGRRFVQVDVAVTGANAFNPEGLKATTSDIGALIPVKTPAAAAKCLGVAAQDAPTASRVTVWAIPGAIVPVDSGAAIAAPGEVEVDATGRVITLAAGKAVGYALLNAAGAGVAVPVRLY